MPAGSLKSKFLLYRMPFAPTRSLAIQAWTVKVRIGGEPRVVGQLLTPCVTGAKPPSVVANDSPAAGEAAPGVLSGLSGAGVDGANDPATGGLLGLFGRFATSA